MGLTGRSDSLAHPRTQPAGLIPTPVSLGSVLCQPQIFASPPILSTPSGQWTDTLPSMRASTRVHWAFFWMAQRPGQAADWTDTFAVEFDVTPLVSRRSPSASEVMK